MRQLRRLSCVGSLLVVVSGCAGRDTTPPVATVTLTPSRTQAALGSPLDFTYRFEVAEGAEIADDYRVFVHVVDADDRVLWYDDHDPPVATSSWRPGQVVEYTRTRFIPTFSGIGAVTIRLGLYRDDSRLPLIGPDPSERELPDRAYRVAGLQLLPETENIALVYVRGWYPDEFPADTAAEDPWKWTQASAEIAFANPRSDVTLYLDYEGRPGAFTDQTQQVTIRVGERPIETLAVEPSRRLVRIPIAAEALGAGEMANVRLEVAPTFIPAELPGGAKDARELGIQVYHAFVERR